MIKQAVKIICIFLFLLSQLQAQAKLESFERAYFGFALEGSVVAPWQIEPSPNPDVQLAGLPSFAHIQSLRMIYNISDRLFASCQAGFGWVYFRNKVSFEGRADQVLPHTSRSLGVLHTQIQLGLQYRFSPRADWSPYVSMGVSVFKGDDNTHFRTSLTNSGAALPTTGTIPAVPPTNNPQTVYYRTNIFQASMKALHVGFGISKKLRNREQLLLLEVYYRYSQDNYLDGYYHFPYYPYRGSLQAYFSQLSFSVSYLFS